MDFPEVLRGAVWHTTTPERYASILRDGHLVPEPELSDSERWGTAMGSSHYPFVRSIGGVSLFDFRSFDEGQYTHVYPLSMWREFVPCSHRASKAIWIEMDLSEIHRNFVDGLNLVAKWKESGQLHRKIMPIIESAHIGPISTDAFANVLVYDKAKDAFARL
jgi:hypothetical protein